MARFFLFFSPPLSVSAQSSGPAPLGIEATFSFVLVLCITVCIAWVVSCYTSEVPRFSLNLILSWSIG